VPLPEAEAQGIGAAAAGRTDVPLLDPLGP
jgi:hypothetical protein